jgi:hypothetical protein
MPTSGAEKKSVLVRLISVRLYATRTWFNMDELMTKFSPPVNVCARLSRPPRCVTSRFCCADARLYGGGVNCFVAMYRPKAMCLALSW